MRKPTAAWPPVNSGVSDMRATESENLDDPCCDQTLAAGSYRFMELINTYAGGIAVARHFIAEKIRGHGAGSPALRILDIGSGSCDIPLAINQWAGKRGIRLQFTCLETSGHAINIARKKLSLAGDPDVRVLQEDIFKHQPAEPYDHAMASMCFHHFSNEEILDVMKRLRLFVRGSVLINDLRRAPAALFCAYLLTSGLSSGIRHDAMLSIRRGFKVGELQSLLRQIPGCIVSVKPACCFRISAVVGFNPD